MKIKVIGTQIYDEHEEKVIQEYENAVVEFKNVLRIKYDGGEIIFDKLSNIVTLNNGGNEIVIELNKEKILTYNTPYGIISMKTYGEEMIAYENPFRVIIKYKIELNGTSAYKNVAEIITIDSND